MVVCTVKHEKVSLFQPWVSEGFSSGGPIINFSRNSQKYFFRGGQKWWNFILPTRN